MTQEYMTHILRKYARTVKDSVIVELGSARGNSTKVLCEGSNDGYRARVYAIDDYESKTGWAGEKYSKEDELEFWKTVKDHDLTLIKKSFVQAGIDFDQPVGLLFYDPGMVNNFWETWLTWSIHLVPGAIIIIKDTAQGVLGTFGPVESLINSGRYEKIEYHMGVTILRKR